MVGVGGLALVVCCFVSSCILVVCAGRIVRESAGARWGRLEGPGVEELL